MQNKLTVLANTKFTKGLLKTSLALTLLLSNIQEIQAQTIWNGINTTFTKTAAGQQDCITPQTCLTRGTSVIYNAICQTVNGSVGCIYAGPCNTEWAYGSLANYSTLTYDELYNVNGCFPNSMIGNPLVLHLINENIYLQVTFNSWQSGGGGNFSYTRSTNLQAPLPVIISEFKGHNEAGVNMLQWTSSQEINNSHYMIQHSTDGIHFSDLEKVNSAAIGGNSSISLQYNYAHVNISEGHHYYRLAQTDLDGAITYSEIIDILAKSQSGTWTIYPNPAKDILTIQGVDLMYTSIQLLDMSGRVVLSQEVNASQASMDIKNIVPGIYSLQMVQQDRIIDQRKVQILGR
ncbi:MAG: T9SS type A sorting domain-containing protein [Chitinophagaceae bacterium]|nr:T9SS type A sorting domain-containing protein [Chitinophagaceae bacterium]